MTFTANGRPIQCCIELRQGITENFQPRIAVYANMALEHLLDPLENIYPIINVKLHIDDSKGLNFSLEVEPR